MALEGTGLNATRDHYISTTFLAIFVVLIALAYKTNTENAIARIGRKDSLYIYIFHVAVLMVLPRINNKLMPEIWTESVYPYIAPIVVFILTMALIWSFRRFKLIK